MAEVIDRQYYERRKQAMITERSSFISHYRELTTFLQPRAGRYHFTDTNRGDKRYQAIVNSRGTQALRSATAGLFNGIMSPAGKWLHMVTPNTDLMTYQPVREWLFKVEELLLAVFAQSNLYNMAPTMLREVLLFGTGAMSQVDDFDDVTRFYTHTVGSYMLAQNDEFEIDTLVREFQMTVRQLVNKFGNAVSASVMGQYDRGNYEAWIPVVHFVEPNQEADPRRPQSKFKPWKSCYYEPGAPASDNNLLSEMGFNEFPAHCPRWDVTAEDVYATDCPGMTTLGDVKGLQSLEREKHKAIQKMTSPPMGGPPSLRNVPINTLPAGATVYESGPNGQKIEPLYTVNPQIQAHVEDIKETEARVNEGFYVDLFRSIDNMEGVQPQNQMFLAQKNAEKLLQLGPVLERLHGEFLNPLVDRTFNQLVRAGVFTGPMAPPQELQGQPLKVRYVSSLASAMRQAQSGTIDKLTMFIGNLVKMGFTSAADNLDVDGAISIYADSIGSPPMVLLDPAKIAAARQQHAADQAQQQKMMMVSQAAQAAAQGGQAANSLANAPTGNGGNALQALATAAGPALQKAAGQ